MIVKLNIYLTSFPAHNLYLTCIFSFAGINDSSHNMKYFTQKSYKDSSSSQIYSNIVQACGDCSLEASLDLSCNLLTFEM